MRMERLEFFRDFCGIRHHLDAAAVRKVAECILHRAHHDFAMGDGIVDDQHMQRRHGAPSFCQDGPGGDEKANGAFS